MTETPTPNPRRVLRWEVPVDDAWQPIGNGRVLHVACRPDADDVVHVWTLEDGPEIPEGDSLNRYARVFGTGHTLTPDAGNHLGTALTTNGVLVWHLFEQVQDTPE
jgi:hypothetical protein